MSNNELREEIKKELEKNIGGNIHISMPQPQKDETSYDLSNKRLTYILDIDGCIFEHQGKNPLSQFNMERPLLPGVTKFFEDCGKKAHKVILLTGRRESMRRVTEIQLENAGVSYDALIMGATNGIRILINDNKPLANEDQTALAFTIARDTGLENIPR